MIGLSQVAAVVVRSGVNAKGPDQPLPPPFDCVCPPEFCLGAPDQDGPGTVDCDACLALDPDDLCLYEQAKRRPAPTTEGGAS